MTTLSAPRFARLDEIPVVDIGTSDEAGQARVLRRACENSAFFYLGGHGVPGALLSEAFAQARAFFDQPLEVRMKVHKNPFHRGYLPLGTTQFPGRKKDLKDSFDFGVDLPLDDPDVVAGVPMHGPNQWPDLVGFREVLEAYADHVRAAGLKVLRLLALSLELEADYFVRFYTKPSILTRVIHYPQPQTAYDADFAIGATEHTDYGQITILAPDPAGGLEIQLPSGEWVSAPFIPDTFVVNLGDLMARWTNDIYRSNFHRVVNRLGRERFSIPTFINPNHFTEVACLPTCSSDSRPAKYPPILSGDYLTAKLRANQRLGEVVA